jgi:hypothetical protein
METGKDTKRHTLSPLEFALLGGGEVGYIREISGERAAKLFGIESQIPADQVLFALHAADGTCMAVADSLDAIVADAFERDLRPVSVH